MVWLKDEVKGAELMKFTEHLYSGIQGFTFGVIVMAYVCDYNRSRLPIAILCLIFSLVMRLGNEYK